MTLGLLIAFLCLPIAVYLIPTLTSPRNWRDPEGFFLANRKVTAIEFANASAAYGIQVASLSVFMSWGYRFGLGAFINPLAWGIGIVVFLIMLPKLYPFLAQGQTLHGFLGTRYRSRAVTLLATLMTLVGFLGAFTAELVWGTRVLTMISGNSLFLGIATVAMAFLVLLYVVRAGQVSVIRADQWQLFFSHLGFVIALISLTSLLHRRSVDAQSIGFLLSVVTALVLALVLRAIYQQAKAERADAARSPATALIFITMLLGTVASTINAILFSTSLGNLANAVRRNPNLYSFEQGTWNILSLALLPMLWQFADLTNWQRIASVKSDETARNAKGTIRHLRLGLVRYAVESPVSWVLAILFGIAIRYANIGIDDAGAENGIAAIPLAIIGNHVFGAVISAVVAGCIGTAILAAMMSTADGFLIGSTFTLVFDIWTPLAERRGATIDGGWKVRVGITSATLMLVFGLLSYWLASVFSFDLLTLLFGAFSAQVSMFAPVIGALVLRDRLPSGRWAFASIGAGFSGAAFSTITALRNPDWALFGPLWAIGLSTAVYVLGVVATHPGSEKRAISAE